MKGAGMLVGNLSLKGDKSIAFLTFKRNLQCQIHPFEVDTS